MTSCRNCHGFIAHLPSPTPELGGDWWHIDDAGERTSMFCRIVETGSSTSMDVAEP